MFQTFALKVNEYLREKVEHLSHLYIPILSASLDMKLSENIDLYAKLATNISHAQVFLDRMWKDFGNFSDERGTEKFKMIKNELSKEVNSIEGKCLEKDVCWSTVEKILGSIYALSYLASKPPEAPGQYFAYHINRFTSSNPYKYIQDNRLWPYGSFDIKPNAFNKCLTNISSVLSNGNLKGVSILDLPAFGSKYEDSCYGTQWSIQLNLAIYNQLMSRSNDSLSNYFDSKIFNECSTLQDLWRDYMSDPAVHDFPPKTPFNSNLFNFTKYIKEDFASFLIAYTASIKEISTQVNPSLIWSDIAKNEFFNDTISETVVRKYGYNDKLVEACVFQEPLMSHKPDLVQGSLIPESFLLCPYPLKEKVWYSNKFAVLDYPIQHD